ncbi:hypothetical protein JOE21_003328 [Desmospora profundinema]|uniref:DUF4190 domain-containing protein n=1 Tax=Desmospora profundinema TaxID=1571184 RepID=A0ABU1IS96_9BACL|nr:hypothetical protein [Desmospora profundinema]
MTHDSRKGSPLYNGYATSSLIAGTAGVILLLLFPLFSVMLGVAGMILGRKGRRSCRPVQAMTGIVLSMISIGMALFIFVGVFITLTRQW